VAIDIVEHVAKAISPYAWDDNFWSGPRRAGQFDRNQECAKRNAREQAARAIKAVREFQ